MKLILDNARYHYSKEVRAYVEKSRIDPVFLPSYLPNLNLH
ncbi:MAG: transposase [Gammaproteobacteria bacterium]|nr:transposase [Gammaproteobacteria bacterium]